MGDAAAKILNAITTVLVAVVVAFALIIVIGKPFGVHAFAVLSGSMEPAYHTGSLIYVKEVKPSALDKGDVITFMTGRDTTVTHRIVDEVQGEDGVTRFQTQGDANTTPDSSLVHPDNVIGTPVLQIPVLGYVVNYIQFPPGTYIAISVCALIVFLMFLPDLFTKGDEDEEGEGRRDEYIKQPRGPQAARPAYAAGPQQGPARQGHPAQMRQPAAGRQRMPQSADQMAVCLQQARPAQHSRPAGQQQASRHCRPQQVRPAQQQARVAQAHPDQGTAVQRRLQPSQQQARAAQPQPAQRPTMSASGVNNPRLRSNPDIRSTLNASKTNSSQVKPARRPVS